MTFHYFVIIFQLAGNPRLVAMTDKYRFIRGPTSTSSARIYLHTEVIDDVQVPRLGPVLAGDQLHQPERVVR